MRYKMDKPIFGFETGMVDFPGRLAVTMFFAGCNLKCPFCYNMNVVTGPGHVSLDDMAAHLDNLAKSVKDLGIVFSGGEPTVSAYLNEAIEKFKRWPLALHTNGLELPELPENPFKAVVLSLKDPRYVGRYKGQYKERIAKALDYYRNAEHKEIRIVDVTGSRMEVGVILGALASQRYTIGWKVNIVERLKA